MNASIAAFFMQSTDRKRLILALCCGIVFDLLFYDKEFGVSCLLFTAVIYAYFYLASPEAMPLRFGKHHLPLVPVGLLALTYTLVWSELFRFLNAAAIPALIAAHTTKLYGGSRRDWQNGRFYMDVLDQAIAKSIRQLPQPFRMIGDALRARITASRFQGAVKVGLGLLIAVPLLGVVVALLASADKMFSRLLGELPDLFGHLDLGAPLRHGMLILLIAVALFCYVRGLLVQGRSTAEVIAAPAELNQGMRFDPVVTVTVLAALNCVYVLFTLVQFSYLFGGGGTLLPEDMTYAEYARRGFAELVVVTVINFTLLMAVLHGVNKTGAKLYAAVRLLLGVLVCCTGVMLFSAFYRLSMYEEAYGYTYTRLLVHAFMVFLLVLFVLALVKLARERFSLAKPYMLAAIASYLLLNYINVDAVIAKNNIARYETSGNIDVAYLAGLSYDAVPQLIRLYRDHPELPGFEAGLQRLRERAERPQAWASWNLSKHKAAQMLAGLGKP
ncbi:DUF4153 domain-containing protein [Paenibacillus thalictri]|uniref:DUF4173 domain-containing protein n=1 Tax=Paenibacillus thalictri TaxID=2527873 RepID=A0A4Q9DV60_9BACL|nr:DUF4173 domain-containing protein [Paenibacillus thalictri]TBL78680.1 DUF4173 domain-containing protein [Paenibacillus thalictri]